MWRGHKVAHHPISITSITDPRATIQTCESLNVRWRINLNNQIGCAQTGQIGNFSTYTETTFSKISPKLWIDLIQIRFKSLDQYGWIFQIKSHFAWFHNLKYAASTNYSTCIASCKECLKYVSFPHFKFTLLSMRTYLCHIANNLF